MRTLMILVTALLFTACSSSEKKAENAKSGVILEIERKETPLTGKNYVFQYNKDGGVVLPGQDELADYAKQKTEEKLKAAGFLPSTNRKAHMVVYFFSYKIDPRTPLAAKVGGGSDFYKYIFSFDVRSYSKRSTGKLMGEIVGTKEALSNLAEVKAKIDEVVAGVDFTAPEKNEKMKGDPSCMPRFGYDGSNTMEGKTGYYINSMVKNSAAEKGGLKIGDKILAVDGTIYEDFSLPENKDKFESLYSGKPVVFTVEREGKKMDKKVTPKMVCDHQR